MLASLTNAAGFIGLAFCTHGGLRSMGLVAVTGLATCLITTLVFLPMTLQYLEWRRRD
jgi:predicted RND superfamily exporter protein